MLKLYFLSITCELHTITDHKRITMNLFKQSMLLAILISILHVSLQAETALFRAYPALQEKIPYIPLCTLPTPITKLETFGAKIGHENLYLKRDDLSGKIVNTAYLYGGNKPRKLEWLLADAVDKGMHTVITYGCAGSNHAVATAVYAKELGLKSILLLKQQPNSEVVRSNLLADLAAHADVRAFATHAERDAARDGLLTQDPHTYFIPIGGSTPLGCLGFVNAAFELYEQIHEGIAPEPHIIYLPIGSCATTAGLILGLALNNSNIKVIAVAVEPESKPGNYLRKTEHLFKEANELLHAADNSIPLVDFPHELFTVNTAFCGKAYGVWTQEAALAVKLFQEYEGIALEGTYSTKPVTAFIDDMVENKITNEVVLIWDTYCGFDTTTEQHAYQELPEAFHHYFQQEVQTLNRLVAIS